MSISAPTMINPPPPTVEMCETLWQPDILEELAELRHQKQQSDSPLFSRRELLDKIKDLEKRWFQLREAIVADQNEMPWEVGYEKLSPYGVKQFVWTPPLDGLGYYLRNLQTYRLRAVIWNHQKITKTAPAVDHPTNPA